MVLTVFEDCLRESEAAILSLCQPLTTIRDEYNRYIHVLSFPKVSYLKLQLTIFTGQ